jgi:IS605 OrfB family transposase
MNPNYIGLVVMDNQTIRYKEIIDLSILNKITNKNKKLHETCEINSRIVALARHHRVELIAFEDLNMKSKDHKKGKNFNRLVNNSWNRSKLVQNLVKKCNINGIKYKEIPAFYSSFVGCLTQPEEYDSIAAAMELSRRARQFLTNQSVTNFPEVDLKAITTRWKEMLGFEIDDVSWINLYDWFKKRTKLSYRKLFRLQNFEGVSLRLKSVSSGVVCHLV